MTPAPTHALTVDLEDWHQICRRSLLGTMGPTSDRLVACTHRILDRLDESGAHATFFVVGMVAEHQPGLVREIAARGHEIASHSYAHRPLHTMSRLAMEADLERSKRQLEDLIGTAIDGFRAPELSIRSLLDPAFASLVRLGFGYDSSVVPRSGDAEHPFAIHTSSGTLIEFPIATCRLACVRVPVGGGYFRVLPTPLVRRALRKLERAGSIATMYIHPYEFDQGFLYLPGLGLKNLRNARLLLLHNFATDRVDTAIAALLRTFQFKPLRDHLDRIA